MSAETDWIENVMAAPLNGAEAPPKPATPIGGAAIKIAKAFHNDGGNDGKSIPYL